MKSKLTNLVVLPCILLLLSTASVTAQKITSLTATAKGKGTLTTTDGAKHRIYAIGVILREGGEAQITIFTDLQLSAQGSWTASDNPSNGIDLTITGGIVSGNAKGSGKLLLQGDGKSISKLTVQAKNATGGKVTIEFVADQKAAASARAVEATVDRRQ